MFCVSGGMGARKDWFKQCRGAAHELENRSVTLGLWKAISKGNSQLKRNCVFTLGDGRRIRFWEDRWVRRAL